MKTHKMSCVLCRQRKIKCDRSTPQCINCMKKGIDCLFPNLFRNQSLRQQIALQEKHTQNEYYYGRNSSQVLEKRLSRGKPLHEEVKAPRLCNISSLVDDDSTRNIAIIKILINKFRLSSTGLFHIEYVDVDTVWKKISDNVVDSDTMLIVYGIVLVANQHVQVIGEPKVVLLRNSMITLLSECSTTPSKVSSLLLLMEFHYFRFDINGAYRYLFLAVSDSYTLGLHESESRPWLILIFYDCIICSSVGRPSAISRNPFPIHTDSSVSRAIASTSEIIWETNLEIQSARSKYSTILELDTRYDSRIKCLEDTDNSTRHLAVVLMANQIKLHYAFMNHDFSTYKIRILLEKVIKLIRLVYEVSQKGLDMRLQFPFLWCFGYQSLLILLAITMKLSSTNKTEIPDMIPVQVEALIKLLSDDPCDSNKILVEILTAIQSSLSSTNALNMDVMSSIDLSNPQFFQDVEFWSSLAEDWWSSGSGTVAPQ